MEGPTGHPSQERITGTAWCPTINIVVGKACNLLPLLIQLSAQRIKFLLKLHKFVDYQHVRLGSVDPDRAIGVCNILNQFVVFFFWYFVHLITPFFFLVMIDMTLFVDG